MRGNAAPLTLVIIIIIIMMTGLGFTAQAEPTRSVDVNAFSFKVQEARIVLGETKKANIVITAKQSDGAPLDAAPPRLQSSTGAVSAPVRTAPGTWTTTFTPPKDSFPHVAIVCATIETATTSSVGFVPLHLWGKGQTVVKTKPKSKVTVFIGNESFGPVDAGSDGAAKVAIVVPPGPERAVARSIDEVGNESQKTIDLGVPTFNRLALIALDDVAPADGNGVARLLAFAVDKKGDPLYEARLSSKASIGAVDKDVTPLAPGLFTVGYRPGKAARGKANIDVSLDGAEGSDAKLTIGLLPGPPVRATVATPRLVLSADDPREVIMEVRLYDNAGNSVPAAAGTVDVDVGRIDKIEDDPGSDGARTVTWILPEKLTGKGRNQKAEMTVRTRSGAVVGARGLTLIAGMPKRLEFDMVDYVVADGQSSVEVRLRALDNAGNALVPTGASIAVDAAVGEIVAGTVDGEMYKARFIPVALDHDDIAVLTGSMLGLRAKQEVRVGPRPRPRLLVGLGVVGGTNYGSLVQAGPDVSLLVRLPGFDDGSVHAGLSVSLLQSVTSDHRAYPVYLEGAWRPLLTQDLAIHLGAGLGFVLTDEIAAVRTVSPGAAAQAVVGVGYRLGPGFIELDARAGYGLTSPSSSVGAPVGAGVVLGYRFGI